MKPARNNPDITIAGAGWAGLAAAVSLAAQGYKVHLIEAAAHTGGRARRIRLGDRDLDNGQHILIGAYRELLQLLALLGVDESSLFLRLPLHLQLHSHQGQGMRFRAGRLFSPLHMLSGLLTADGLSVSEKTRITSCWTRMLLCGFQLPEDMAVSDYLERQRQDTRLQQMFWRPLCIAALNTDIDKASAQVFLNVLRRSFTGSRHNSDILLPKANLNAILPDPAFRYIGQQGGYIHSGERVRNLMMDDHRVSAITTSRGHYAISQLILATPPRQTIRLLGKAPRFSAMTRALSQISDEPITTLYMQYPAHVRIEHYMQGVSDGLVQWFIDRRSCGQPGLIAAVISAHGPHMAMHKQSLTEVILAETRDVFPDWPDVLKTWLIREKHATFSCTPAANALRPPAGRIATNLWLAGDYTATGLPATLEGAVASGVQCAQQILQTGNPDIADKETP